MASVNIPELFEQTLKRHEGFLNRHELGASVTVYPSAIDLIKNVVAGNLDADLHQDLMMKLGFFGRFTPYDSPIGLYRVDLAADTFALTSGGGAAVVCPSHGVVLRVSGESISAGVIASAIAQSVSDHLEAHAQYGKTQNDALSSARPVEQLTVREIPLPALGENHGDSKTSASNQENADVHNPANHFNPR